jgi:hypothetical protein
MVADTFGVEGYEVSLVRGIWGSRYGDCFLVVPHLKVEDVDSSETLVHIYQATRRHSISLHLWNCIALDKSPFCNVKIQIFSGIASEYTASTRRSCSEL